MPKNIADLLDLPEHLEPNILKRVQDIVMKSVKGSYGNWSESEVKGLKDLMNQYGGSSYDEATGKVVPNYMKQISDPNPTLGDAASLMSQNMVPGGAAGAGAIALADGGGVGARLGTVGGGLAKGFDEAKAAGRTWMGLEGAPKFEINDMMANLKGLPKALQDGKLVDYLDHPELYKNYPEMQDLTLRKQIPTTTSEVMGHTGMFNPADMSVTVTPGEDAKSRILHEVQHAIQQKENFARGGSPGDVGSEHFQNEADKIAQKMQELITTNRDENSNLPKEIKDEVERLRQKRQILRIHSSSPEYEGYRRLAGEAESRNVEGRMNMTAEDRMKNPFTSTYDVPIEDQIVRMRSGKMAKDLMGIHR